VDATDPVPSATPPLCFTTAPKPTAVPRDALVLALSGVPPASAPSPTATPPPPASAAAPIACEPVARAPVPMAIAFVPVAWAPSPTATELVPLATACGPTATALAPVAEASGKVELVWKYLVPCESTALSASPTLLTVVVEPFAFWTVYVGAVKVPAVGS